MNTNVEEETVYKAFLENTFSKTTIFCSSTNFNNFFTIIMNLKLIETGYRVKIRFFVKVFT